eukprot:c46325_g1_i1 orf=3-185(-)
MKSSLDVPQNVPGEYMLIETAKPRSSRTIKNMCQVIFASEFNPNQNHSHKLLFILVTSAFE